MSILGKIRNNTWIIFFVISIFLLFIIFDTSHLGKFLLENRKVVGKVNGENIYDNQYYDCIQFLKSFNKENLDSVLKNNAWKLLIREKMWNKKIKDLGIKNTDKDFWEQISKKSIYSKILDFQNIYGNMDINKFQTYLKKLKDPFINIKNGIEQEKSIWNYEKNNINSKILANKYMEMLKHGLNSSPIEYELNDRDKRFFSVVDYILIPYSEIENRYNIFFRENDIYNYINKNIYKYKSKKECDTRVISIAISHTYPSKNDEKNMNKKIKEIFFKLKNTNYDPILYSNKNKLEKSFDTNFYFKRQLPSSLQYFVRKNKDIGSMFGPVKENNIYVIAKLTGKKTIFNSVLASHILISHKDAQYSYNKRNKKEAKIIANNVYNFLLKNPNKFNFFAVNKSDDIINAKKYKGSLGWISYEGKKSIGTFDLFSSKNKKGTIGITETKLGYHVIKIDDKKQPETAYQFAIIIKTLNPSKYTKDYIQKKINIFIKNNENSNLNTFVNNARKEKFETIFFKKIKKNQWNIVGLNTEIDKEIIDWAFSKERKKVNLKIFTANNNNKDNIIVYLFGKKEKGIYIEKIKNDIGPIILNKKIKKIFLEKFKSKNLEEISNFFSKKIHKHCELNFYNSIIENCKEPKVIGSIFSSKLYKTSYPIFGIRGVYFVRPLKRFFTHVKQQNIESKKKILDNYLKKIVLDKFEPFLFEKTKVKIYRK
ncbi:SurA N-terminal domain-containing protein [Blattabacterium cuenoti]|uniref:SurA N-terminal domain-containing protein n=1 Tax=Blattabacterium cuenoti TaxID=1653831 RepID=UPI00163CFCBA|nr:SurA N-terminal domain-containing protein [Blattabacterium cuenoti]